MIKYLQTNSKDSISKFRKEVKAIENFRNYGQLIQVVAEYNCVMSQIRRLVGILGVPDQMDLQFFHEGTILHALIDKELTLNENDDKHAFEKAANEIIDYWALQDF